MIALGCGKPQRHPPAFASSVADAKPGPGATNKEPAWTARAIGRQGVLGEGLVALDMGYDVFISGKPAGPLAPDELKRLVAASARESLRVASARLNLVALRAAGTLSRTLSEHTSSILAARLGPHFDGDVKADWRRLVAVFPEPVEQALRAARERCAEAVTPTPTRSPAPVVAPSPLGVPKGGRVTVLSAQDTKTKMHRLVDLALVVVWSGSVKEDPRRLRAALAHLDAIVLARMRARVRETTLEDLVRDPGVAAVRSSAKEALGSLGITLHDLALVSLTVSRKSKTLPAYTEMLRGRLLGARLCVASPEAHSKPNCEQAVACSEEGRCSLQRGRCVVVSDQDCQISAVCAGDEARCTARDGECIATSDEACRATEACASEGRCAARAGRCVPATKTHCRQAGRCRSSGLCGFRDGRCLATSDTDCKASSGCEMDGSCSAVEGKCDWGASSPTDCDRELGQWRINPCKKLGRCGVEGGRCVATSNETCQRSEGCKEFGQCTARSGQCVAASSADCSASFYCKKRGMCAARDGACVKGGRQPKPH